MIRIVLRQRLMLFITVLSVLFISPMVAFAADISVNGSSCTLADAITAANTDAAVAGCDAGSDADTISLSRNITLSATLPAVTSDITIEGAEYSISGDDQFQVLNVDGETLTLNDLTVSNGLSNTTGGGISVINGSLILNNSEVLENVAADSGGGIYANNSDITVNSSEISRNAANRSHGGGIYFVSTSDEHSLSVTHSYLKENTALQDGGAVYLSGGNVDILKSSFFRNVADEGGALDINSATMTVTNSTFGYNSAREGGGLSAFASDISLLHTTWAYNSAREQGGGLALIGETSRLSILNTIISDSPSGGDCHSGLAADQIIANTSNIIEDGSCPLLQAGDKMPEEIQAAPEEEDDEMALVAEAQTADEESAEDELRAQQEEVDPAPTPNDPKLRGATGWPPHFPLQPNSPAMNSADSDLCDSLELDEDQPGTTRPQGPGCEIGAWEAPPTPTPVPPTATPMPPTATPTDQPTQTPPPTATATATLPPSDGTPPAACVHSVAQGDTLFSLAQRYNTTVEAFRRFNQLLSDSLSIGQVLLVPVDNCDPDPYVCVTPANVYVLSASGYVQCMDINTNRLDKHPALASGMIFAVEIRGFVNQGSEVCFPGQGNIVFLDTITSPPIVSTLSSYGKSGLICGQIDRPGIVVLVALESQDDAAQPETVLPSFSTGVTKALSNCEVSTNEVTRLLDTPGDGAVIGLIPFGTTLNAHERTADQFGVTNLDTRGWIDAGAVQTAGTCD